MWTAFNERLARQREGQRLQREQREQQAALIRSGAVERVREAVEQQAERRAQEAVRWERAQRELRRATTNYADQLPDAPPRPASDYERSAAEFDELNLARRMEELTRDFARSPGWQVPTGLRNQWPMYHNEAVTVTTAWGPVTVGRGLARMYDLGGWPDEETLIRMVEQQAAQLGGGRF